MSDVVNECQKYWATVLDTKVKSMNVKLSSSISSSKASNFKVPKANHPLVGNLSIVEHIRQKGDLAKILTQITTCLGYKYLMNLMISNRNFCKCVMKNCFGSHFCIMLLLKIIRINKHNQLFKLPSLHSSVDTNNNLFERTKDAMFF